jgi:hypothetical protein
MSARDPSMPSLSTHSEGMDGGVAPLLTKMVRCHPIGVRMDRDTREDGERIFYSSGEWVLAVSNGRNVECRDRPPRIIANRAPGLYRRNGGLNSAGSPRPANHYIRVS